MERSVPGIIIKNWDNFKRDFLWRAKANQYSIMIAEFMLQRTRAEQVEPIYKRFLKQYPSVYHLARAREKSVAKYTDSLGLHWRAKHFIAAARYIVEEKGGKFPETQSEMLKIPGVGDYVAGAVLAVCKNTADYVVDSNIARFINRYYNLGLQGELRRKKIVIEKAIKLFKTKNQRDLLFALLDYTALICKPVNPDCENCIFKKCSYICNKN